MCSYCCGQYCECSGKPIFVVGNMPGGQQMFFTVPNNMETVNEYIKSRQELREQKIDNKRSGAV